jgi:hypothetical protein
MEERRRLGVAPLEIVEHQHDRTPAAEESPRDRLEESLSRVRIVVGGRRRRRRARVLVAMLLRRRGRRHLRQEASDLGAPDGIEIGEPREDRGAAQPIDYRGIAQLPLGCVRARARDVGAVALGLTRDLLGEPRLPDAGLADDADDARSRRRRRSRRDRLDGSPRARELHARVPPADERPRFRGLMGNRGPRVRQLRRSTRRARTFAEDLPIECARLGLRLRPELALEERRAAVERMQRRGAIRRGRVQAHLGAIGDLVERIDLGRAPRPADGFNEVAALFEQRRQAAQPHRHVFPQPIALGGHPFREAFRHEIPAVALGRRRQRGDLGGNLPSSGRPRGPRTCKRRADVLHVRRDPVAEPDAELPVTRRERPFHWRQIAPQLMQLAAEVRTRLLFARVQPESRGDPFATKARPALQDEHRQELAPARRDRLAHGNPVEREPEAPQEVDAQLAGTRHVRSPSGSRALRPTGDHAGGTFTHLAPPAAANQGGRGPARTSASFSRGRT